MEQKQNEQQQKTVLCANGCGFFGNPITANYCSKCWRDSQSKLQQQKKEDASSPMEIDTVKAVEAPKALQESPAQTLKIETSTTSNNNNNVTLPSTSNNESTSTTSSPMDITTEPAAPVQKDPSRCLSCKKKVGLLGFKCRCGFVFCSGHRHADQHNCTFDYKAMQKTKLEAQNPQIVKAKIEKI